MTITRVSRLISLLSALAVTGCMTPPKPSDVHIRAENTPVAESARIPAPVQQAVALPKPKDMPKTETYSVVVKDVRVHDLLFALARDAKVNVDIHPGITGVVTLNAIEQTLPQILTRLGKQVDMRWELDGANLSVMPDSPYLRTYRVDYVNMSRDMTGSVSINTQITASGLSQATAGSATASNAANTEVKNVGRNRFWESLERNVKDILRETDKILPEGSSETIIENDDQSTTLGNSNSGSAGGRRRAQVIDPNQANDPATLRNQARQESQGTTIVRRATFREAASVIVNPETGIVVVRATSRQHERVQEFLDLVGSAARRQVLIEATIAEVRLSNTYAQGIDWTRISLTGKGWKIAQGVGGTLGSTTPNNLVTMTYTNADSKHGNITGNIKLLESFGTVKVLSSPRISVLNNQTAVLKVVDNIVYFHVQANTSTSATTGTNTTVTTTPQSVAVGLVMSVTPQISNTDTVLLNLRPTISRVTGYVQDPNPQIPAGIVNQVPQIQTREMESVLRVNDGDVAVLGGLMDDSITYNDDAIPGIYKIPLLGQLFTNRNDNKTKTELVVFLRPVVIKDASLDGDYARYRALLPDADFFKNVPNPPPLELPVPSNPYAPGARGGRP